MRWQVPLNARALDCVAAAMLAGAVGFAAFGLGAATLAFILAPIAFIATAAALGRVTGKHEYRLAEFEIQAVEEPRPPAEVAPEDDKVVFLFERPAPANAVATGDNARQALSDAFAQLKNSLR